jgi:O-antigen ligase
MRFAAASLLALALVVAQAAHSGALVAFLGYPAYGLAVVGALLAGVTAIFSRRWPWPALSVVVLAAAGYAAWRCVVADDHTLAAGDLALILGCAAMWCGVALGVTRNDARFVFLAICLVAGCVQVVFGLLQLIQQGEFAMPYWLSVTLRDFYAMRFPQRARGLFLNPNQFAWMMNALALMALSVGIWGRVRILFRIGLLYLAGVFGVMAILSASRGGLISLVAGVATFLVLSLIAVLVSGGRRRVLLLVTGGVMLTLCLGAIYAAFSTSWVAQGRFGALLLPEARSGFFEDAIRLFQTQPLQGSGPGVYRYAARLYRTGDVSGDPIFVHDDWLQGLAEYGFVGFGAALLVLILALAAGARGFFGFVRLAARETGSPASSSAGFVLGAVCGIVAGAVHSNVDFNLHIPANALLAAALLGLVTGARPLGASRIYAATSAVGGWVTAAAAGVIAVTLAVFLWRHGPAEYYVLRADNALQTGDANAAIQAAERGLRLAPDDATLLAQHARGLYEYDAWLQVSQADPSDATVEEASDEEDIAVEDEPEEEDTTRRLSDAERAALYQRSAAKFARAAAAQPNERVIRIGWAKALAETGQIAAARRQYLEAIELDPMHAYPWASYGDFLSEREDVTGARRIYEIGAGLPGGQYCRDQVGLIDDEAQFAKEEGGE